MFLPTLCETYSVIIRKQLYRFQVDSYDWRHGPAQILYPICRLPRRRENSSG